VQETGQCALAKVIHATRRFVEQEDAGCGDEDGGEGDALLLAGAEIAGVAIGEVVEVELDQEVVRSETRPAVIAEGVGEFVADCFAEEERDRALREIPDIGGEVGRVPSPAAARRPSALTGEPAWDRVSAAGADRRRPSVSLP
jgi:hypothetical protein